MGRGEARPWGGWHSVGRESRGRRLRRSRAFGLVRVVLLARDAAKCFCFLRRGLASLMLGLARPFDSNQTLFWCSARPAMIFYSCVSPAISVCPIRGQDHCCPWWQVLWWVGSGGVHRTRTARLSSVQPIRIGSAKNGVREDGDEAKYRYILIGEPHDSFLSAADALSQVLVGVSVMIALSAADAFVRMAAAPGCRPVCRLVGRSVRTYVTGR